MPEDKDSKTDEKPAPEAGKQEKQSTFKKIASFLFGDKTIENLQAKDKEGSEKTKSRAKGIGRIGLIAACVIAAVLLGGPLLGLLGIGGLLPTLGLIAAGFFAAKKLGIGRSTEAEKEQKQQANEKEISKPKEKAVEQVQEKAQSKEKTNTVSPNLIKQAAKQMQQMQKRIAKLENKNQLGRAGAKKKARVR